jgi:hypothetical protein
MLQITKVFSDVKAKNPVTHRKSNPLKNKDLASRGKALGQRLGGGPPKFVGMSHDVIENKGRKKVTWRFATILLKAKGLFVLPRS